MNDGEQLAQLVRDLVTRTDALRTDTISAVQGVLLKVVGLEGKVDAIHQSVFASGHDPLATQVAILRQEVERLRVEADGRSDHRWQIWLAVFASLFLPLIEGVVGYFVFRH